MDIELPSPTNDPKQKTLYRHIRHAHKPVNVNEVHREERDTFNGRLADWITAHVGTMQCAYLFSVLATMTLLAAFSVFGKWSLFIVGIGGAISSYWLQLVLLPAIMVGQNRQSHHAELLADEQFKTTQKTYSDIEQVMIHLDRQDAKLVEIAQEAQRQREMLEALKINDMYKALMEKQSELLKFLIDHNKGSGDVEAGKNVQQNTTTAKAAKK